MCRVTSSTPSIQHFTPPPPPRCPFSVTPITTCRSEETEAVLTGDFFSFFLSVFCWFQAFFCLSGDETNIAPPSARHTCTLSRCCVRGLSELVSYTRDGARRSPAPPAPARCPEEASAGDGGAHPARHTRAHPGGAAAGSPAQGAARRARSCSQRDRPHPPGLVLRIRWVPRGAGH